MPWQRQSLGYHFAIGICQSSRKIHIVPQNTGISGPADRHGHFIAYGKYCILEQFKFDRVFDFGHCF